MKKSQGVAYVVLGLILLLLAFASIFKIYIVLKQSKISQNKIKNEKSDPRTDVVYLVKKCIDLETKNALYLAAKQGGVINISKWKNNGQVIYWFYWNESFPLNKDGSFKFLNKSGYFYYPVFIFRPPALNETKKEVENYLKEKIESCINQFSEVRSKYNVFVMYQLKNLSLTFYNKSVKVSLYMPITIINPKNQQIIKIDTPFVEILQIPYKEDYLTLLKLFEKAQGQGLYGFYLIFLSGLTDKIPYGVLNLNCKGVKYSVKKIKNAFQFLLNHSDNICYSNCKYIANPYNSFETDLKLKLPNYYNFYTKFFKIKYFDAFLRFEGNASERYYYGKNKVENGFLIFNPMTPEEFTHISDLEFKGNNICSGQIFYDLIANATLSMIDSRLREPLVFKFAFDFGLMNNRPITLAASYQPEKSIQYYYVNKDKDEFKLWPRRKENVFFNDPRNPLINYQINLNLDFQLANIKKPKDLYLKFTIKDERIPWKSSIFCLPFYFIPVNKEDVPLAIFCSQGTITLENNKYSALIDINKLHKSVFFDKGFPKYLTIEQFGGIGSKNNQKRFLDNFGKEESYKINFIPINKQIVDIFEKEDLIDNNFNEFFENNTFLINSLLTPYLFNPTMKKLNVEVQVNKILDLFNYQIKRNFTIYFDNKNNFYSSFFVKKYLYGSSFSAFNLSFGKFLNESLLKVIFKDLDVNKTLIPVVVFGSKEFKFKKKYSDNLVLPVVYNYYLLAYNKDLTKVITQFLLIYNYYKNIKKANGGDPINFYNSYFDTLYNYLVKGVKIGNKLFIINATNDKQKHYKELLQKRILQLKYICLNEVNLTDLSKIANSLFFSQNVIDKEKKEIEKCIDRHLSTELLMLNGAIFANNFNYSKNLTSIRNISESLKPKTLLYKYDIEKYQKCVADYLKNNKGMKINEQTTKNIDNACKGLLKDQGKIWMNNKEYLEFLANPLAKSGQKDLNLNITPYFGHDFTYKVNINNNGFKKYKNVNDLAYLVITKLVCNDDNGKKVLYLSNYGKDSINIKTKIPFNCVAYSKFIYKYKDLNLTNGLLIVVDNNINNPYLSKVLDYIKFIANKKGINVQIKKENPINEFTSSGYGIVRYYTIKNPKTIIITDDGQVIDFLKEKNVSGDFVVINLGRKEFNVIYWSSIDLSGNKIKNVVKRKFHYYVYFKAGNIKEFLEETLLNNPYIQIIPKKIVKKQSSQVSNSLYLQYSIS